MYTATPLIGWVLFVVFILALLVLDLGIFHKKAKTVTFKESILWSIVWIALAMAFNLFILYWRGENDFYLFLTGYVIEKSLSVDNLFVFILIFSYFKIPPKNQHKLLFYGIIGALVMRGLFIWAGIAILQKFTWVIYLFGAVLILSGLKMVKSDEEANLESYKWINRITKFLPITTEFQDDKFFFRNQGKLLFTPLFLALIFIELSDLIFAVDSIPAIIGITSDPFLVFTSNVFAILGLRSLYFALNGLADLFHYLKYGLAFILMFIGTKMLMSSFYHVPISVTMGVIFSVLAISITLSLCNRKKDQR